MPKKRVKFPVYVDAYFNGSIDVPDGIESYEDIQEYIKEHLNEADVDTLTYIPETDVFNPDCDMDIYYYPTKQEELELDGMKYRLIEKCRGRCSTVDHGMSYDCPIYPLCKKHNYYCEPSGKIKDYLYKFENYEIRDAYADINAPFSGDELSYERKRKQIKEYCNHKDFLHCNIVGICCKHNHSKSQDCYDITDALKYKWSHENIDEAIKIINKEKRGE